jgi:hypothetical protein
MPWLAFAAGLVSMQLAINLNSRRGLDPRRGHGGTDLLV